MKDDLLASLGEKMIKKGKENVESSWWERMQCKRVKES
jgi:hypothetical protein